MEDIFGRTPEMLKDIKEERYEIFVKDCKEPLYISRQACFLMSRFRLNLEFEVPIFDFTHIDVDKETMEFILEYLEYRKDKPIPKQIPYPFQTPFLNELKDEKNTNVIDEFDLKLINKYDSDIFSDDIVFGDLFKINTEALKTKEEIFKNKKDEKSYQNLMKEREKYEYDVKQVKNTLDKFIKILKIAPYFDDIDHPLFSLVCAKISSISILCTKEEEEIFKVEKYSDKANNLIQEFLDRDKKELIQYLQN